MSSQSTVKHGFTLIEILVTISIIAILSVIGMVAYSSVVRQGRDSKRQSDLRAIQSALEQYNSDQGFYPDAISFGNPLSRPTGGTPYMNSIPSDPINDSTNDYTYAYIPLNSSSGSCDNSSTNRCFKYCLYALLENSNPGIGSCAASETRNFAVTPP